MDTACAGRLEPKVPSAHEIMLRQPGVRQVRRPDRGAWT